MFKKYFGSWVLMLIPALYAVSQKPVNATDPPERFQVPGARFNTYHSSDNPSLTIDYPDGEAFGRLGEIRIWNTKVKGQRIHGPWQSFYLNGRPMDAGQLLNGIPSGEWKYWDSTGRLRAIRHYHSGKLSGVREEMRLNHPRNWFFPLTGLYKKNKSSALKYLKASFSFQVEVVSHSVSLDDRIAGNAQGLPYQPPFTECLHHGVFINFAADGSVKDSGSFKNGLPDGFWIHHNEEGAYYWLGSYSDGLRQQEWKMFAKNGKLLQLVFYDRQGRELWRKKF
jgi:antitoxin component YwqK of YwqJK toxin-antitoxin module